MPYDQNGYPVETHASDLSDLYGKALYALSLLLACVLMPIGAVLALVSEKWR